MPPLPPGLAGQTAPQPQMPDMMMLAGMGGGNSQPAQSPGMSQISDTTVRMGSEIDQALKTLAQAMPQLAPWVEKTCFELRQQIGNALNSGGVPTSPEPAGNVAWPDGSGRM